MLLHRTQYGENGTRGVLSLPGEDTPLLHTLELPWRDNKQSVSCIPEGEYKVVQNRYYNGGYESVEITPVPNRTEIQVHIGNTIRDIDGCIVVGLNKGTLYGLPAVLSSTPAFEDHFWPAVRDRLPTEIIIHSKPEIRPAGLETLPKPNLQEHLSELSV